MKDVYGLRQKRMEAGPFALNDVEVTGKLKMIDEEFFGKQSLTFGL